MEERMINFEDNIERLRYESEQKQQKEWLKSPERKRLHKLYKRLHKQFIEHYEKEKIDVDSPQCANCPDFLKEEFVRVYNSDLYENLRFEYLDYIR